MTVSQVLGDEHYKWMFSVTGPANNSKDFILLNGHVGHKHEIACIGLVHVYYKR